MTGLEVRTGVAFDRRRRVAFAFFFVTAIAIYFAYNTWKAREVLIDDAFISYRYAANWVNGKGVCFNPGETVEGYTNFLWMAISAAAIALGGDPVAVTVSLGVYSFLAALVLCAWIAFFKSRAGLSVALIASLPLGLFILPKGFASLAGTGLETSFLGLVLLLIGLSNHVWTRRGWVFAGFASSLPLIALLTRLDAALPVVTSGIVYFFQNLRVEGARASTLRTVGRFGPALLGLAGFLAWKQTYYGAIIPNTYWAKGADFVPILVGIRYAVGFLRHAPWVMLLAPLAIFAAIAPNPGRRFSAYAVLSCLLHAAYVVKVGGDFMQWRFMWEVVPLFLAACAFGLSSFPSRAVAASVAILALPLATTEPYYEHSHGMHEPEKMNDYTRAGVRVGQALSGLPPDTLVATTLAGTVGYYSRLPVLDQWGLNDAHVARLPITAFGARGHVKRAPLEYLQERNVNLVVDHPVLCPCSKPCVENKPSVFVRIGKDECVRAWYMHATEALTQDLCRPRADVFLHNVRCPGERVMRIATASTGPTLAPIRAAPR